MEITQKYLDQNDWEFNNANSNLYNVDFYGKYHYMNSKGRFDYMFRYNLETNVLHYSEGQFSNISRKIISIEELENFVDCLLHNNEMCYV